MANNEPHDVNHLMKQLIGKILNIQQNSKYFKQTEKKVLSRIASADSLYFLNEKQIWTIIESVSNKFLFHGYITQAKELIEVYRKFLTADLSKEERNTRLNIVKFLLEVSESPTNNITDNFIKVDKEKEEEVIDWPKYLNEGIPRWSPTFDDSSDCWSEDLIDGFDECEEKPSAFGDTLHLKEPLKLADDKDDFLVVYHKSKTNLQQSVQNKWFSSTRAVFEPSSEDREANIALLWNEFINCSAYGLLHIESSNIVSEYKVMREVIWQLYEPHESFCFSFRGDLLVPKQNVTIASVRPKLFESFLTEFVPYINWFQSLNEFHAKISKFSLVVPDTYKSYSFAVTTIVAPVYTKLQEIENEIKLQETTFTLIKLSSTLKSAFKPVKLINEINEEVLNFQENAPVECATTLLCGLHRRLLFTTSKFEQDIYLTLYLHSLYKYFSIIDSWLVRDVLEDPKNEFVVLDEAQFDENDFQSNYLIKELDESIKSNSIIDIICTKIVKIGENVHLLRLLKKLHLLTEDGGIYKESFYESFLNQVLISIAHYFNEKCPDDEDTHQGEVPDQATSCNFPTICPDKSKYLTEMDKLENLIDTSNGLLMNAFQTYLNLQPSEVKKDAQLTLFEKISNLTQSLFPAHKIIEQAFLTVINERFGKSGLLVKNVLNGYNLDKQFSFLKSIFLFNDDLIFPFYRKIFKQLELSKVWGNPIWLTSYLQDLIMDVYPQFYMETTVDIKEHWKLCTNPLKACKMININYKIHWPINVIIREEQIGLYKGVFQFILKIKWAHYTLNSLFFEDIQKKGKSIKRQAKSLRAVILKLFNLRFGLLNIFSSIQHYILGRVFSKCSKKFNDALESACSLDALVEAHFNFISTFYRTCIGFQDYNNQSYGFVLLLYLVKKLRTMWENIRDVNDDELTRCESSYLMCHKELDPIINPTDYEAFMRDK